MTNDLRSRIEAKIEKEAQSFLDQSLPVIFKFLERAQINYDDEQLALMGDDSFKAGAMSLVPLLLEMDQVLELYSMTNESFPEYGTIAREARQKLREWVEGEK